MKRIKMLAVLFSLLFLGIGILLLDAWDMQHAQAAPRPDAWLAAAPLPEPMAGATIQCPDQPDIIYMVGGVDGHGTSNKLYKYDATTNTWDTTLLNLPIPLRGHAVACYQGRIYVAGGLLNAMNRLFIYNIIGDVWSEGANLPDDTGGASLGAWDGKLYLMGGSPLQATPYTPVSHVDIYDIASNTWEAEGGIPLPTPTAYAYSGVQRGRYYFITGGNSGDPNNNVNQTQRYDMANNDWEVGPEFTSARGINAGSTTATNLYVQGGDVNGGGYFDPTDLVETLDLSAWPAGEWIDLEDPLPQVSMVTAGGCTEARTGGETWAIGGADMNLIPFAEVYFRPAEPCFDFYFGDLAREEMQLGNQPGATAHYVLPVINDGSEVDSYDISVSSGWVVSASLTVGPVVPGDAGLVYVDIEVPEDATPGDFDVATVTLTSQADSSASDNARLTTTVTNWHEAASVPEDIAFHERAQCASDPNGFYVLGGSTPDLWALDEVFYYSANINEWTPVTNLPRGGGWGTLQPAMTINYMSSAAVSLIMLMSLILPVKHGHMVCHEPPEIHIVLE